MEDKYNNEKKYVKAVEKVKSLKQFYIHLFIFLIANPIILILMLFVEKGDSENFWIWLSLTTVVTWTVALMIHGWSNLGSRILFKKSWEDRKIQEFIQEEEQLWE